MRYPTSSVPMRGSTERDIRALAHEHRVPRGRGKPTRRATRRPSCESHASMRIVVTGGLGFIGIALARRLLDRGRGDRLLLFDAPAAADPPADIAARAEIRRGDIRDADTVRGLL